MCRARTELQFISFRFIYAASNRHKDHSQLSFHFSQERQWDLSSSTSQHKKLVRKLHNISKRVNDDDRRRYKEKYKEKYIIEIRSFSPTLFYFFIQLRRPMMRPKDFSTIEIIDKMR